MVSAFSEYYFLFKRLVLRDNARTQTDNNSATKDTVMSCHLYFAPKTVVKVRNGRFTRLPLAIYCSRSDSTNEWKTVFVSVKILMYTLLGGRKGLSYAPDSNRSYSKIILLYTPT